MACRPTALFPNTPKGKYPVCTKGGPTVDASTSKGLRRSPRLLLKVAMMKTSFSDGAEELRGKCWLRVGSSTLGCRRRRRRWLARVILSETFPPKSTTTLYGFLLHFWKPNLAHLFWHSYIVMAIILCQKLSSQSRRCETTQLSHLLSSLAGSILLCFFWLIYNFVLHGTAVFYDPCFLSPIALLWLPQCFVIAL